MNSEDLASKIPDIFENFGIKDLREYSDRYVGSCPIHCGDHATGFRLFKHGKVWRCYTHNCHEHFGKTLVGLIRGLLSRQIHLWSNPLDQSVSWKETYAYIKKQFNISDGPQTINLAKFNSTDNEFFEFKISRANVRRHLMYPCRYYIDRGISESILDKYDVGVCKNPKKKMFFRAVCPIYDENYQFSIGCLGRSLYPQCEKCKLYHSTRISCPNVSSYFIKWRNSEFDRKNTLYNLWFSKDFIKASKTIILCEGPADVWKLEQAGIKNSVAIFGTELTDQQILKINKLNVRKLVLCLDNDEPGVSAAKVIVAKCKRLFHIEIPQVCEYNKDIADTNIEFLQDKLKEYA